MKKLLTAIFTLLLVATSSPSMAAWPWVSQEEDSVGDTQADLPTLDISNSNIRMGTDKSLQFHISFGEEITFTQLHSAGYELKVVFDLNLDGQKDLFVSSLAFGGQSSMDGVLTDSNSGTRIQGCKVSLGSFQTNLHFYFGGECFSQVKKIGYSIELLNQNRVFDSAPDSGWYTANLNLLEVFKCSKEQKGKHFVQDGKGYFCMLTSGTVAKGKWAVVQETKVTDAQYLKMYACTKAQKGNQVVINRTTGTTKFTCSQYNGKWTYISEAVAKEVAAKAAAAEKAKKEKAAAAARAKKIKSAKHAPHKAYFACNLDGSNKKIWVEVADSGKTLIMSSVGRYRWSDLGVSFDDYQCVANYLKMPRSVQSKVDNTRAIDGTLEGRWGSLNAFWNYHPDAGLDITFTLIR